MPAKLVRTPESSSTMAIEIGMAKRLQMAKRDVNTVKLRTSKPQGGFKKKRRAWVAGLLWRAIEALRR